VLGAAFAVALVVFGSFAYDAVMHLLHVQFSLSYRADAQLRFVEARGDEALGSVRALPGVQAATPLQAAAVRLVAGPRSRRTAILAVPMGSDMLVARDADLRPMWEAELAAMRKRILAMRKSLHGVISAKVPGRNFDYFLSQRGISGSPSLAYIVQGSICVALVCFGALQSDGFEAMVEFTAPVFWSFLFLVGISVFILRFKHPNTKREFSVPLYPLTPIVFCASCAYLAYSSFAYAHSKGAVTISLYVMLVGVVALLFLRAKKAAQ
jgi:hypothetical protein